MAASYLHGVETIELDTGTRPITGVKTAVIGLVGTAPIQTAATADQRVNVPVLITNQTDAAKYFGVPTTGYTIPSALRAIFDQGKGIVVVVNVFDPTTHTTAVTSESQTFDATDKVTLAHPYVTNVVVKNSAGTVTYALATDYTIDAAKGTITRVTGGTIGSLAMISVSYSWADPSKVLAADIVGTVTEAGQRTGLKGLRDSYSLFGFYPKLVIAPAFSTQVTVATEINTVATDLKAIGLVDAPIGTTVSQAITGRGPSGTINFNFSSERLILCYPYVKVFDTATNAEVLEPFSQRLAGVIAAKDVDQGYWWSPSNTEILGITGIERPLTAMIDDPNSEVNQLNSNGITTIFNSFGTGFRTWGNRTAAWPTVTHPKNFISVRRVADILQESVRYAMLQFLDRPITTALIDAIADSVNSFIRTLISRGALIDGKCSFDAAKNPNTEIAAGHLTFDIAFMPTIPAERISFQTVIDISLLKSLTGA